MTKTTLSILAALSAAGSAIAQDALKNIDTSAFEELDSTSVVGSQESLFKLAGAAAYLDEKDIRTHSYTNINRVVAKVPGVFARDETGTGFFPNLSIRGADGVRMERTTIMEDGVLMAPAPYSAPSAYYSPKVGRMSGLEILKGSSQVKFGPHTSGGVINYISTAIPEEKTAYIKAIYGSDSSITGHAYYGDTLQTSNGEFGYLLEMFYQGSDGFRKIQPTGAIPNPANAGHTLIEPMLKLSWTPDTALKQKFEFKYGYSDLDADETYLGLADSEVLRNPDKRYAGSRFDNITTQHQRTHLKYSFAPTDNLSFEALGYYNEFKRNWYKLNKVGQVSGARKSLHSVVGDPTGAFANEFAILNGTQAGFLDVKNNSRRYRSYGLQFSGKYEFDAFKAKHTLDFGTRFHKDHIRRYQWADEYEVDATGGVVNYTPGYRTPAQEGDRLQQSTALAFWIEDEIDFGKLVIKPGLRYEHIDMYHADYASGSRYNGSLDYVAPGIGFTYDINDENIVYGGIYKGVSTPGPRSHLRSGVDLEKSIGYELGLRHRTERLNAEVAVFYNDYSNIISSDAGLGLGATSTTNAGAATVYGLEASVNYELVSNGSYRVPVYATATLTSATIDNPLTGGGNSIYSGGGYNARIPYIPEFQASIGAAIETEKWGVNVDASFTGKSYGTAAESNFVASSTSRNGAVGNAFIVDLSAHYQFNNNTKFVAGVSNLFDKRYISSRLPEGARANPGRSLYAGFEIKF